MINWVYYPASDRPPEIALSVVRAFESVADSITSQNHHLNSNSVLALVSPALVEAGFRVETGKRRAQKLAVPVLFGRRGRIEKSFEADAYHESEGFIVEVEAGRACDNNQFLKDLFEACLMQGVRGAAIAVRNNYRGSGDFETVCRYFDTLYASTRLQLPLEGILIVGY